MSIHSGSTKHIKMNRFVGIRIVLCVLLSTVCGCTRRQVDTIVLSPDRSLKAEIETVRGVTRDLTLVAVSDSRPGIIGTVLGTSHCNVFQLSGTGDLKLQWKSTNELLVSCLKCSETDSAKLSSEWHGVKISFDIRPIEWKSQ